MVVVAAFKHISLCDEKFRSRSYDCNLIIVTYILSITSNYIFVFETANFQSTAEIVIVQAASTSVWHDMVLIRTVARLTTKWLVLSNVCCTAKISHGGDLNSVIVSFYQDRIEIEESLRECVVFSSCIEH